MNSLETLQPDRSGQQVGPRNPSLIKPIEPLVVWDLPDEKRTEELVDFLVTTIWANRVLREYNGLPEGTSRERKVADGLVTKTAAQLLGNPQNISIADNTWRRLELSQNGAQESNGPFSELVRKERLALIKEKWRGVKPEQLAQLVRLSAEDLLRNYFRGPKSRNQRIEAYYNFVSGVLDLAEDDEAFRKGMEIALHATDILPKVPSLVEQTVMLSLPYNEEKRVFQQLLVVRSVIAQVRFMGSWNFDKYYEDRSNFIITDSVAIEEGNKRKENVIKKIGENETEEMYNRMKAAMRLIARGSPESLSEERKQALMGTWPFNLAFDDNDPLNQKFQRVLSERRVLAQDQNESSDSI